MSKDELRKASGTDNKLVFCMKEEGEVAHETAGVNEENIRNILQRYL